MRSSRLNIHFGEKHIKNVLARFEIENLATTLLYVVAKFFIKCTPLTASSSISVFPAASPTVFRLGDAADYDLFLARAHQLLDADGLGHG